MSIVAYCQGCGCDDEHACVVDGAPCMWLRVDYARAAGVCSACPDLVPQWDAALERAEARREGRMTRVSGAIPVSESTPQTSNPPVTHKELLARICTLVEDLPDEGVSAEGVAWMKVMAKSLMDAARLSPEASPTLAHTRLLIEAEGLLCDPNGGPAANELASRIRALLSIRRHSDETPPVLTFPDDMTMAESHGDPRITGRPEETDGRT